MKVLRRPELVTLLIVSALAALPLLANPGFLNTRGGGDSPFLLFRLQQLYTALRQGVFPVRWMPDAAFGLGYPFYNYYAALPYYLAAIFKGLGASYVLALKLTHLGGFIVAAFGLYGWLRCAGASRGAAWLAATAYTFAPFHLVNLYVRGDSLGEFWAFALYPLCLWAACRLAQRPTLRRGLPLALAYAALLLTHNISALIFSPFLGLYILFLAFSFQRSAVSHAPLFTRTAPARSAVQVVHSSLFIALGLALSAFFWLPALRETGYGQLQNQTTGYFNYANHFRGRNLVQLSLLFNYDVGSATGTPFAMGLAQTALVALGLAVAAIRIVQSVKARHNSTLNIQHSAFILHPSSFILLSFLLSSFMITRYSQPLWAHLPLLPFVQFPWRFLSVQSLFASALIGLIMQPATDEYPIPNTKYQIWTMRHGLIALLGIGYSVLSIIGLRPDFVPVADADVTANRLQLYEYFTGNIGATIRNEYLPRWTLPRPYTSEEFIGGDVSLKALSGRADGQRLAKRAASQTWDINVSSASAAVAVPLLYWPGWQARADEKPLDVRPADGLGWIAFDLPQGRHKIELSLRDTPTRRLAGMVSLIALALAVVIAAPWKSRLAITRRALFGWGAATVTLLGLAFGGHWLNARTATSGAPTMDFDQQAYLTAAPVHFGNGDTLVNYSYSLDTLRPGDFLGVTLQWQASGRAAFDLALVSPAEHLLTLPHTFAGATGAARGLAAAAVLRVPEDAPPGIYLIRLGLTEAGINTPALTSGGQTRGRIFLRPIRIEGAGAQTVAPMPLAVLTPSIALLDAVAAQPNSSALALTLHWQATAPVPANLLLALRLRDSADSELAALDTQPTGGIYPTGLWRAGEIIPDTYQFDLPSGLPPGDYPLTLTLYDAATLTPVGAATVPVHLSQWSPAPGTAPAHSFTDALALHSVLLPADVAAGGTLAFTARWLVLAPLPDDYGVRWSLISPNGEVTAFADGALAALPSSQWAAGAFVAGRMTLPVPVVAGPGRYTLNAQLLASDSTLLSPAVAVGALNITASTRTAEPPPMQYKSGAVFGAPPEAIALAGYDLALDPTALTLTLHWQALGPTAADYKYFVHLFNPADESIAAQADAFPAVPTSQWFAGEAVSQTVTLPLEGAPAGTYNIGVGWYNPATDDR
ncbi:MAG: hypothetical protein HY679_04810, partial [Chloroflexi bacterium]|nr:hypothetical protein [Chloroflexota bacterium]